MYVVVGGGGGGLIICMPNVLIPIQGRKTCIEYEVLRKSNVQSMEQALNSFFTYL